MTTEEKLERLHEQLAMVTETVQELNEEGVNLSLKITTTVGGSTYKEFLARNRDASSARFEVADATRTESLINKPKGGW